MPHKDPARRREYLRTYQKTYRQENRQRLAIRQRERNQEIDAALPAPNNGLPWTDAETSIALRHDLSAAQAAAMLGRSAYAVQMRRYSWRRRLDGAT